MEIGKKIKALRLQRGVTQEAVAGALGVLPQTVSKWELGTSMPDITLLPAISAYFGVTVDDLFALTDETRMQRIESMLDNQKEVDPDVMDREAQFLLDKAEREPKNAKVWSLLAYLENHRGDAAKRRAEAYAKKSLQSKGLPGNNAALWELVRAAGLVQPYWELADSHRAVIDYLQDLIAQYPQGEYAYHWLMEALLLDHRYGEAREVCQKLARIPLKEPHRVPDYMGIITWLSGDREGALQIWNKMVENAPPEDEAWGTYALDIAYTGDYARAAESSLRCGQYRKPPRATWPWEQGAYFQELAGDLEGAIASLEKLLEIRHTEHGITSGAGEEAYRGEIQRLQAKLNRDQYQA